MTEIEKLEADLDNIPTKKSRQKPVTLTMKEHNEIIEYFCQQLPDRHNLLAWRATMYRDGEIFEHPEGMMYQIMVFDSREFPQHHVMVLGMN